MIGSKSESSRFQNESARSISLGTSGNWLNTKEIARLPDAKKLSVPVAAVKKYL